MVDAPLPQRRQLRLSDYDYSSNGAYFVTLCVNGKHCLFGSVVGDEMRTNEVGEMVRRNWQWLPERFRCVTLDAFIVMPNHVHGIVLIQQPASDPHPSIGLSQIMSSFKALTIVECRRGVRAPDWPRYDRRLWQRGYFDHIIRNEEDLLRIREYIVGNPGRWAERARRPR